MVEMYCPVCDRKKDGKDPHEVLEKLKKHVSDNHPEYDPQWYETYPEDYGN